MNNYAFVISPHLRNSQLFIYRIKLPFGFFLNYAYNYRPQTKFAKVMFLNVSVCPRGGSTWAGTPRTKYTPWDQVHPPDQVPPQAGTPPRSSAYWDIQATSRWYASYWNAFLFFKINARKHFQHTSRSFNSTCPQTCYKSVWASGFGKPLVHTNMSKFLTTNFFSLTSLGMIVSQYNFILNHWIFQTLQLINNLSINVLQIR